MDMDEYMEQWTNTPGTLEAAVMALTPEERASGLQILSKLKRNIYTYAEEANVKPYEWDGQTAADILEAFEYVEGRSADETR